MTVVLPVTALFNYACTSYPDDSASGTPPQPQQHKDSDAVLSWPDDDPPHGTAPAEQQQQQQQQQHAAGEADSNSWDCTYTTDSNSGAEGNDETDMKESGCVKGNKRKLEDEDEDYLVDKPPPKRISPFLNTPKQRKDERRRILKLSVQKLRQMDDPEHFLRRSVLINNTLKKVQQEMREEKRSGYSGYACYRRRSFYDYEVLNNSYLSTSAAFLFDEPCFQGETEKITDDMTDSLVRSLEACSAPAAAAAAAPIYDQTSAGSSPPADVGLQEKQITAEMDTVFNNLIRALGET